jgi:hypothetical protein
VKHRGWLAGLVALLMSAPAPAAAQEVAVVAAGPGWTGGLTDVDIFTPDDRLEVWVYEAYLSGVPGNAVSDDGQLVCRTPCHLTLANGMYTFYVGRTELGIDALGTPQGWEVEDSSIGSLVSGIILTAIGSPLLLAGLILLSLADQGEADVSDMGWGTTIAGGVGVIVGAPLLATWKGKATALTARQAPVTGALGLVPSLALFPGRIGPAGWGLQLAGSWPGL